jgi:hypothetical protein
MPDGPVRRDARDGWRFTAFASGDGLHCFSCYFRYYEYLLTLAFKVSNIRVLFATYHAGVAFPTAFGVSLSMNGQSPRASSCQRFNVNTVSYGIPDGCERERTAVPLASYQYTVSTDPD